MRLRCRIASALALAALAASAAAAPRLNPQAEPVGGGRLKMKVLAGAEGIPPPTPQAKTYIVTRNGVSEERKVYDERELQYVRELLGMWKDKRGNVMRLARPEEFPWGEGVAWKTTKQLKDGTSYYIDFAFAEHVADKDAERLLKDAASSLSAAAGVSRGAVTSMKWWNHTNECYRFMTDLDRAKGAKFINDAMRIMEAMRKSYEFYVPPQKKVGVCTVRVFKTLAGYREYRSSTGEDDKMSCGLWDPSRDELLIAAENRDQAHNTMRHEAFHQYLSYATGVGNHVLWFNEGHACFFENVKYNPAKNTVKVLDTGSRASWVSKNPAKYANAIRSVLRMSRQEFYSGEVNMHYCTAWAIVYFLEKGAYTSEAFAPYRTIVPTYLELTAGGMDPAAASAKAWEAVEGRDVAADFLKFWKEKRKASVNAR